MTKRLSACGMGFLAAVTISGAAISSCRAQDPPPARPAPPPVATAPVEEPGAVMKPMKKIRILVGGCLDECAEPGLAATRFLEATVSDAGPVGVAKFVDSTAFVLDGERLGDRWVGMWKELRPASRKEDILRAAGSISSWSEGLTGDQVDEALTSGLKPIKVWTSEAVYRFEAPGLTWRLVLRPRGLEWLVVELERNGGARRVPGDS